MFSRFRMAVFIKDKKAETVAEANLEYWVKSLGSMKCLHTDRGSEFLNSEMAGLCDYLGVKMTATAAFTPNANGINERNHAVVDTMMDFELSNKLNRKHSVHFFKEISPLKVYRDLEYN